MILTTGGSIPSRMKRMLMAGMDRTWPIAMDMPPGSNGLIGAANGTSPATTTPLPRPCRNFRLFPLPPQAMKKLLLQIGLLAVLLATGASAQSVLLQPLVTFGTNGDGTVRPGDAAFLTPTNQFQRGLAYNPTTGHLLVVDRSPNSSANNDVYILDGDTGATLGILNNGSTLAGGNAAFTLNLVGVSDDGVIYVCNLTSGTSTAPQTRL